MREHQGPAHGLETATRQQLALDHEVQRAVAGVEIDVWPLPTRRPQSLREQRSFVGEVEHCERREGVQPLIFHGGRYFTELPL